MRVVLRVLVWCRELLADYFFRGKIEQLHHWALELQGSLHLLGGLFGSLRHRASRVFLLLDFYLAADARAV